VCHLVTHLLSTSILIPDAEHTSPLRAAAIAAWKRVSSPHVARLKFTSDAPVAPSV